MKFVLVVYVEWWITAPVVSSAPQHDIKLLEKLNSYIQVDKVVGEAAIGAFKNHMWYLSQELVPLDLFSDEVTATQKKEMADKINSLKESSFTNRHGNGFGKPNFPDLTGMNLNQLNLNDFIGQDSIQFFNMLKIDKSFLIQPVEAWPTNTSYQSAKSVISSLKVVNDCAERGVKLGADFLKSAKIEKRYQDVLQTVENDRKMIHNLRKRNTSTSSEN